MICSMLNLDYRRLHIGHIQANSGTVPVVVKIDASPSGILTQGERQSTAQ